MKRLFSLMLSLICLVGTFSMPVHAATPYGGDYRGGHHTKKYPMIVEVIQREDIRDYLSEQGEPYDPNLVAVYRNISVDDNSGIATFGLFSNEYYALNTKTDRFVDASTVLKEYRRPAGRVLISEGVEISNTFSGSAGVSAEAVEMALGFSVTEKNTFAVEWEQTYTYNVRIVVHPIYERMVGELWEDDAWEDDYIGRFNVKRAIGDEIRVYRN